VTGSTDDAGGQYRADAINIGQSAAVLGQGRAHPLGDGGHPGVHAADLGDQVAGKLLAGLLHR